MRFISNLKKKTEERRQEQLNNIRVLAVVVAISRRDISSETKFQIIFIVHKNFKELIRG